MSEVKSLETGVETRKRLVVGYSFDSAGRTITETDIVNFACLSGDFNRLPVDEITFCREAVNQRGEVVVKANFIMQIQNAEIV